MAIKERIPVARRFDIKSMALGGLFGAVIMFAVGAVPPVRPAWDYKIISGRLGGNTMPALAQQIDQAAADRWEVVSAASQDGYPFVILRRAK